MVFGYFLLGGQKKVTRNPCAKCRKERRSGWVVKLVTGRETSWKEGREIYGAHPCAPPFGPRSRAVKTASCRFVRTDEFS